MAGPGKFYKIGKIFGALGGQDEIFEKNLRPAADAIKMPLNEFKAVPDDEENPMENIAQNMKKAQKRQALLSIVCCVASIGFMILFYTIFSG
ncbi:MAG TPA: hypothetical protein VKM55_14025 [Candidatus Lokiarchaeia archaeon]|nr:hypothetical protein [Candidatus Lokiarchaeia archaeon]